MNNKDLIHIEQVPQINLEYALGHIKDNVWLDAEVAESRVKPYGEDLSPKDIRNASVALIDEDFEKMLKECVNPIVEKYAESNGIEVLKLEGYHLVKYEVGQFFKEHVDETEEFPRKISVVLYLNDNYDGGTITFTKLKFSFKPNPSSIFIFPSTEEFAHSADPIVSGTKYAIVGFWE